MRQFRDGIKGERHRHKYESYPGFLYKASLSFNARHLDSLFRYCYKKSYFFITVGVSRLKPLRQ